jgi:hypothetical protein
MAITVLIGVPGALKGSTSVMNIGLGAIAGLSLTAILAMLDMIIMWKLFRLWHYGIQEGLAFTTSSAALALGLAPWRQNRTIQA